MYWRVLQAWETCRWTSHSLPVTGKTLWKYQMYVSLKSFRYRVQKKEMMRKWAWVKDNFLQSCNKEEERNLSSEFPILYLSFSIWPLLTFHTSLPFWGIFFLSLFFFSPGVKNFLSRKKSLCPKGLNCTFKFLQTLKNNQVEKE